MTRIIEKPPRAALKNAAAALLIFLLFMSCVIIPASADARAAPVTEAAGIIATGAPVIHPPRTGDTNIAPMAIAVFILAAIGAVVLTLRGCFGYFKKKKK